MNGEFELYGALMQDFNALKVGVTDFKQLRELKKELKNGKEKTFLLQKQEGKDDLSGNPDIYR